MIATTASGEFFAVIALIGLAAMSFVNGARHS